MCCDESSEPCNMQDIVVGLPCEVTLRIFALLSFKELKSASLVSKAVRRRLIERGNGSSATIGPAEEGFDFLRSAFGPRPKNVAILLPMTSPSSSPRRHLLTTKLIDLN
jgi:hypothetical protein